MANIPPVSVTISERVPMLILDARLALAPGGLLLAVRLARHAQVWLPCRFWDLIDQAEVSPPSEDLRAREEAMLWKSAWYSGALHGTFFWVGEARREGVLPEGMESWLPARHEGLDRGLNPEDTATAAGHRASDFAVCCRQSVALAVALAAHTPLVLTTGPKRPQRASKAKTVRRDTPQLCRDVNFASTAMVHIEVDRDIAALCAPLRGGRIEASLTHMRLSGVTLAVVHVTAPFAVDFSTDYDQDEVRIESGAVHANAAHLYTNRLAAKLWTSAQIYWHELK